MEVRASAATENPKRKDTKLQPIRKFPAPTRLSILECFAHREGSELAVNLMGPTTPGSKESVDFTIQAQWGAGASSFPGPFRLKEVVIRHLTRFDRPAAVPKRMPAECGEVNHRGPKASQKAVEAHRTLSVIAGYPLHHTPPKNWPEPDRIRRTTERKLAIPLHPPGGCEPISLRKSDAFSL